MAILHPSWSAIEQLDQDPTPGERALLEYLEASLDDEWRIYFQSPVNGYLPDVVVVHPRQGAQIFEVKDWNLEIYSRRPGGQAGVEPGSNRVATPRTHPHAKPDEGERLWVRTRGGRWEEIRDPLEQARHYREELWKLLPELGQAILDDSIARRKGRIGRNRYFNIIQVALYFHGATDEQVGELYGSHPGYATYLSSESLRTRPLHRIVPVTRQRDDELWTTRLAGPLMGCLSHSITRIERRAPIRLTPAQREKATPTPGHRRIKGVAGSGKSLIVVNRAALLAGMGLRTLVVGFNLTLRQYLRYLAGRTETEPGPAFDALVSFDHFHGVCARIANELGLSTPPGEKSSEYFDDTLPTLLLEELERRKGQLPRSLRYDAILIDEGQDFLHLWYKVLERLLTERNELLLVADPEQNLYERDFSWTDGSMRDVQFRGRWGSLDMLPSSMRLPAPVLDAANRYAIEFLGAVSPLRPSEQPSLFPDRSPLLRWKNVEGPDLPEQAAKAALLLRDHGAAPADTVILTREHEDGLRIVGRLEQAGIATHHIFAESWHDQRMRKELFDPLAPELKACTFQSFKGWEEPHVVVAIPPRARLGRRDHAEIYMAITRTRHDLIVVNADRSLDHVEDYFHT